MQTETIKRMFDACYLAKRTRDLLPPLPEGIMPSYIQYMDTIHLLEQQGVRVRISDIGDFMQLPRPGVTRTVKEMEQKGLLQKIPSPEDGRVTYLSITEAGEALSRKYDAQYFAALAPDLEEISEEEANCMIRTIETFYRIMLERRGTV